MQLDTARWLEFCSFRLRLFNIFFTLNLTVNRDLTWSCWRWIFRRRWWRGGTWRAWLGSWTIGCWCWWWWPIWWWWWCGLHFHSPWPLWVWSLFFSHHCHWPPCRNFWTFNSSCIRIRGGKLFSLLFLIGMIAILPLHLLDKLRDGLQLEPPLCTTSR